MFLTGFTLVIVFHYFPLLITFFVFMYSVQLLINPSANEFVFADFIINHNDWLIYSGGTDRSGELKWPYSDG